MPLDSLTFTFLGLSWVRGTWLCVCVCVCGGGGVGVGARGVWVCGYVCVSECVCV